MICTRCGTEQRRETARFCHVCGATIEPVTASPQSDNATFATVAATHQPAHGLRPISLTPPEPAGASAPESAPAPELRQAAPYPEAWELASQLHADEEPTVTGSQPFTSSPQAASSSHPPEWENQASEWQQEPPTITLDQPQGWQPADDRHGPNPAAAPPSAIPSGWAAPDQVAYSGSPEERSQPFAQEEYQAPMAQSRPRSRPEPSSWQETIGAEEQQSEPPPTQGQGRQAGWNSGPPMYGSAQPMTPHAPPPESGHGGRERPFPAAQHHQRSVANDPFGDSEARPAGRATPMPERPASPTPERPASPMSERPIRSAAGPVPGSLTRPRPAKRRKVPLGVWVTIGLLLVFLLGGFGIYAVVSSAGGQELSAFVNYTDPQHHFTIKYPTVWNYKHLDNGVRFADATNTAQLSVTYTPNTSKLTAQQFADQEAQKQSLNTPDTRTFAGQTWVVRSGIVTQKSGIAQDIFIFVALDNNLLYEITEVTPLDGYQQPNQAAFMPMLQSLTLS